MQFFMSIYALININYLKRISRYFYFFSPKWYRKLSTFHTLSGRLWRSGGASPGICALASYGGRHGSGLAARWLAFFACHRRASVSKSPRPMSGPCRSARSEHGSQIVRKHHVQHPYRQQAPQARPRPAGQHQAGRQGSDRGDQAGEDSSQVISVMR